MAETDRPPAPPPEHNPAAANAARRQAMLNTNGRYVDFSSDDWPYGVFIPKDMPEYPKTVARTAENSHLFLQQAYGQGMKRYVVHYMGSGLIASILEACRPQCLQGEPPRLAFFSKQGDFFNKGRLLELPGQTYEDGQIKAKHTAIFAFRPEHEAGRIATIAFAVDDIYCISLAVRCGKR